MLLPDVNVLVYAHRAESTDHGRYAAWLHALAVGTEPFGISELGCSAFVRIVTNQKIWEEPTTIDDALAFVAQLRGRRNARPLTQWDGELGDLLAAVSGSPCARQARG